MLNSSARPTRRWQATVKETPKTKILSFNSNSILQHRHPVKCTDRHSQPCDYDTMISVVSVHAAATAGALSWFRSGFGSGARLSGLRCRRVSCEALRSLGYRLRWQAAVSGQRYFLLVLKDLGFKVGVLCRSRGRGNPGLPGGVRYWGFLGLAKGTSDLRLLAWWQWRPSSTGTCLRTSSSLALSIGGSGAAGFFVTCCALVAAEKEPYKMHQLGGTGNLPLQEFRRDVPPGWSPGDPQYPLKMYLDKLQLPYNPRTVKDEVVGPLISGRLHGRAAKVAMTLRIPRRSNACGTRCIVASGSG